MLISVAIPCYRSEYNLGKVVDEIRNAFSKQEEYEYQIILVCDGSPDRTDETIRRLCAQDKRIVGVLLSRNFTQSNAKMAALRYVQGEVLVFMDDDGQHPAEDIFKLVGKVQEGYDVVYAYFPEKKQSCFKIWTSQLYGFISEKLGKRPKGIKVSSFLAYSRFAVNELMAYTSPVPTPGGYLYTLTSRFANIESTQRKRVSGTSGYNLAKLINLSITNLTNFTIVPLRLIDLIGFLSAFAGVAFGLSLCIRKLFFSTLVPGYTSNMVVMLILGGLVLVSLGLVGEYVGRIYIVLSNQPQYVVREAINVPYTRYRAEKQERENPGKSGNTQHYE